MNQVDLLRIKASVLLADINLAESKLKARWIQGAIKNPGVFTAWCRQQGFDGVTQAYIETGKKDGPPVKCC
jgi:hypothetical protein